MLKNVKRFVETFKNYASYIHNFSWTDNFQNPRKKGKKEKKKLALEAIFRGYSIKKVFLKISQNSLENTCARLSFLLIGLRPATLLKWRLWHRCFGFTEHLQTTASGKVYPSLHSDMSKHEDYRLKITIWLGKSNRFTIR